MNRTRAALLDGARRAVLVNGTKITMAQVAAAAGVAKATLYNHFRTREAVLAALVLDEVSALAARAAELPLDRALAETAHALATHPALRALARTEPATVAALGRIDLRAEGWRRGRDAVAAALAAEGLAGTELVLRWLASYLLSPASTADDRRRARDPAHGVARRSRPPSTSDRAAGLSALGRTSALRLAARAPVGAARVRPPRPAWRTGSGSGSAGTARRDARTPSAPAPRPVRPVVDCAGWSRFARSSR